MLRIVFFLQILVASSLQAQGVKVKPTASSPEVESFIACWGPVKSGSAPAVQVASVAPAAIFVKDNTGATYVVSSFRMNYKFRTSYKDDETEQLKFQNDLRVADFSDTAQLNKVWIDSIRDNVKAGDTILINKILFRNKSGKLQMAPDIKIGVN